MLVFPSLMSKALILVDFEKEWVDPDSDYYVGDIADVIERANRVIDACREKGFGIIFTQHVEEEDAFVEGTGAVEIMDELHKERDDVVITKRRISPFFRTNLDEELAGVEDIVICGILTNLCVRSLAQDAYDRDFSITIIKDCCVAFDEEMQEFTFKDLKETREEISFVNADEFLSQ